MELCAPEQKHWWQKRIWLSWSAELYSFGRLYRDHLKWPDILPLFWTSDHGVQFETSFENHEKKGFLHVTWNEWRFIALSHSESKRIIQMKHPYIDWRKRKGLELEVESKGKLVWFFSHSLPNLTVDFDLKIVKERIKYFKDNYKEVAVCLHMHDVNKGLHEFFINQGVVVVSAGNTSSVKFVERLYDILCKFEYVCSNKFGSELFYAHELGCKYFTFDTSVKYKGFQESSNDEVRNEILNKIENLWSLQNLYEKIDEKNEIVTKALSLYIDNTKKFNLKTIIISIFCR